MDEKTDMLEQLREHMSDTEILESLVKAFTLDEATEYMKEVATDYGMVFEIAW